MAELLADIEDIQKHLDPVNLRVTGNDSDHWQVEAHNIIKSQLAGMFTPLVLYGWDAPANTPSYIRGIAGRLIAAYIYRQVYARETGGDVPGYAAALAKEAFDMIGAILDGTAIVLDENMEPIATLTGDLVPGFYPDDTDAGPYFTMIQPF
jgi:hypothetical protein